MAIPDVLASTVKQATPLVEQFAQEIIVQMLNGVLQEFFVCEPVTNEIVVRHSWTLNDGEVKEFWTQASWGAVVVCRYFELEQYESLCRKHPLIDIDGFEVTGNAKPHHIEVRFWLSARVERE